MGIWSTSKDGQTHEVSYTVNQQCYQKKKKVIMHSVLQRLQPWSIAKKFKDQTQVLQEIM